MKLLNFSIRPYTQLVGPQVLTLCITAHPHLSARIHSAPVKQKFAEFLYIFSGRNFLSYLPMFDIRAEENIRVCILKI